MYLRRPISMLRRCGTRHLAVVGGCRCGAAQREEVRENGVGRQRRPASKVEGGGGGIAKVHVHPESPPCNSQNTPWARGEGGGGCFRTNTRAPFQTL